MFPKDNNPYGLGFQEVFGMKPLASPRNRPDADAADLAVP
jgi:hypothetical protein